MGKKGGLRRRPGTFAACVAVSKEEDTASTDTAFHLLLLLSNTVHYTGRDHRHQGAWFGRALVGVVQRRAGRIAFGARKTARTHQKCSFHLSHASFPVSPSTHSFQPDIMEKMFDKAVPEKVFPDLPQVWGKGERERRGLGARSLLQLSAPTHCAPRSPSHLSSPPLPPPPLPLRRRSTRP